MRKLELLLLVMLAGLLLLLIGIGAYVSLQTQEIRNDAWILTVK